MERKPSDLVAYSAGTHLLLQGILHDFAFFHHKRNALGRGDVGGGIARHGDDVGEFAYFEGADFIGDTEKGGGDGGGGTEGIDWGHSQINHELEFFGVLTVRENGGVGTERDLHAELHGVAKH